LKIWHILALNGALVLLFSGAFPLISIHFIGVFTISFFDLYRWFGNGFSIPEFSSEWTEAFASVQVGLILAALLFPVALIAGFASLRIGPKACLIAGALGMACWLSSLFSVWQLKILMAQLGGPLGGLTASFVHVGYGVYVGVLGSALLITSYFVGVLEKRKSAGAHMSGHGRKLRNSDAMFQYERLLSTLIQCNGNLGLP